MSNRRKIIVTGASSGIGRASAIRFAGDGCDVCVNARREERFRELVITFPPGNHLVCAGSYDDAAGVAAFLAGPDAMYLTGQNITSDGGLTITF
ncbi:MAG: SDR family NAD(P)-dependent oxidoreductase [Verrucomicrobiota bacterium]